MSDLTTLSSQQIISTFHQYLQSIHLTLSASKALMAYAAGSAITVGLALVVELVIIFHGLPRGRPLSAAQHLPERPRVSVIVPTYREGERLLRTVNSLLAQDYEKDLYEVIIAGEPDDPTLDGPLARLGLRKVDGAEAAVNGVRVKLSLGDGRARGKPVALNRAFSLAEGDVIGVLDADGAAPPDMISRAVRAISLGFAAAQMPRELVMPPEAKRTFAGAYIRGQGAEMALYNRVLAPALIGFAGSAWITGTGYFVRREDLEEVGLWTPWAPTEDLDLSAKLMGRGKSIAFVEGAPVLEEPLTSLAAVIRQKERWVRGSMLATFTALRGVRNTWPLLLFLIMPAWGYLLTPWLGILAVARLHPQLLTWTLAWSAAWFLPSAAYYVSAISKAGRQVRPLPAAIAIYLVAGLLSLPKFIIKRYEWRGSRS